MIIETLTFLELAAELFAVWQLNKTQQHYRHASRESSF